MRCKALKKRVRSTSFFNALRRIRAKKVVPKLRQEVKVKVDTVTSDDIKIYYTGKFQDFTALGL